ncbi:MAG: response regulator transcription factor [Eubacteriales bacterium]
MSNILIVDDEKNVAELIKYNLEIAGYETIMVHDGKSALNIVAAQHFDLVILDIMLPEIDGLSILRYIKSSDKIKNTPVIMLTAKSTGSDIVLGLEIGADDYIVKPFNINELVARVKVQLRKSSKESASETQVYELGDIIIDNESYTTKKNGEKVPLTNKEFELLLYLVKKIGKICTRDAILSQIWGYEYIGGTRTVDVHIRSLRKKLFDDNSQYKITTMIGVGYKLEKDTN